MKRLSLLLSATLIACSLTHARADESATPAPGKNWTNKAESSFVSANGNTRSTTVSAKNLFAYKWPRTGLELEGGALGARNNGATTAESFFGREKVSYDFDPSNYVFEQVRWDKDRFAGIDNRYDNGVGVGHIIVKTPKDNWAAELGGGYLIEDRVHARQRAFTSGRAYTKYQHTFTPTASVSQDAEYLHDFADKEDFRVNTESALTSALSTHFSLKVSYVWKHVGRPPAGFGKNDTITSVALIATY